MAYGKKIILQKTPYKEIIDIVCVTFLCVKYYINIFYNIGTPYLLSLGLTKSVMSLVWIAGPLSGKKNTNKLNFGSKRERMK